MESAAVSIAPAPVRKAGFQPGNSYAFKPGQSGNPSGPSKDVMKARYYAAKFTIELIDELLVIARTGSNRDKLKAIEMLLDRALGKPVVIFEQSNNQYEDLPPQELAGKLEEAAKTLREQNGPVGSVGLIESSSKENTQPITRTETDTL